jgi:hypothetical protein
MLIWTLGLMSFLANDIISPMHYNVYYWYFTLSEWFSYIFIYEEHAFRTNFIILIENPIICYLEHGLKIQFKVYNNHGSKTISK